MKQSEKAVKAMSYVSGIAAIAGAVLLVALLALSLAGRIHPRKARILLRTPSISRDYDAMPHRGSEPWISGGSLLPGHTLEVTGVPEYTRVGVYPNEPIFVIRDATGADVTKQYEIIRDFGTFEISPRPIILTSVSRSKVYDGKALSASPAQLTAGSLVAGHRLVTQEGNSLLFPGEVPAMPPYQILDRDGNPVTDQYQIQEEFGIVKIRPIPLTVTTESAKKQYDGKPLSADGWEQVSGTLLEGHRLHMAVTASLWEVGAVSNEGTAWVTDANGQDVSALYNICYKFGTLEIGCIPLYISTGSAQKIYDGTPLSCDQWQLTAGALEPGAVLRAWYRTDYDGVGSADNILKFSVTAADGTDVTRCYSFICDYGTLTVKPRAISIRTGSAQKVYDGSALSCDTYTITSGSLVEGEQIQIVCTSITEIGYSDNYVLECTIYREEADGRRRDVSACYRVTFDFGTLKITAQ